MQIAAELGIQPSQLRRWEKAINGSGLRPMTPARGAALTPVPANAPSPADNAQLRRELERDS
jgi:transposase